MNSDGNYFAGFYKGGFKWSSELVEARVLERVEQFHTIQRHEPLMELIYDYT